MKTLHEAFPESVTATDAFIRDGMSPLELAQLSRLIKQEKPGRVLEVGMANGTSSVVIADALAASGGGHLTSIDPNQTAPKPHGYASAGLSRIAKFAVPHRLIEEMDFKALPQLAADGEQFDTVLVDGFHSFDLTFLDLFYADKLLKPGGLLICHDSSSPAVFKALRWLENNKPYSRLSPPLYTADAPIWTRLYNRIVDRGAALERKANWHMLVAYRKQADHAMKEHELKDF